MINVFTGVWNTILPNKKNNDRLTVLNKLQDKYNYEGINYPASYEDIKVFQENDNIGVVVYAIDEDNCII